jgi:NAD(P)H-dependent FMN reductase
MLNVGIIIGSTRPGRKADVVGRWVHEIAAKRGDASYEVVDIAEFRLPHLDEPMLLGELKIADVRSQVALSLFADFEQFTTFKPNPHQEGSVHAMLDDLVAWGQALRDMRARRNK